MKVQNQSTVYPTLEELLTQAIVPTADGTAETHEAIRKREAVRVLQAIPSVPTLPNVTPNWIVPGLIVQGGFHVFTGEAGSMKSMLALHLAGQISSGGAALGLAAAPKMPVIYVDKENPAGLIQDRFQLLGITDDSNLRYWGMWCDQQPPDVSSPFYEDYARLGKTVMFFDSFVRFHQQDENNASEMRQNTAYLRKLCSLGSTVVLLHHRGKQYVDGPSSPFRGSSEIAAGCDIGFCIEKEPTSDQTAKLSLKCFKNRYEPHRNFSIEFDGGSGSLVMVGSENDIPVSLTQQIQKAIVAAPGIDVMGLQQTTGITEAKLRKRLKEGAGRYWSSTREEHGKQTFHPLQDISSQILRLGSPKGG
jgi:hypothetical protein